MTGPPWDQPGADPMGDMREAWEQARRADPVMALLDDYLADLPPLTDWQRAMVDSVLYGRPLVLTVPRRAGRSMVERAMVEAYQPPRHTPRSQVRIFYDEVIDLPTGWELHWPEPNGWLIDLCTQGLP